MSENTPPLIKEVKIYPDHPTVQTRAKAIIQAIDRDNDRVSYTVKWFVNGKEMAEGEEFSADGIKRDDRIYVIATPYDGKEYGKPVRSNTVTVGNTQPKIVQAKLEPETIFVTTQKVKVSVKGEDPDGDSLKYICRWFMGSQRLNDSSTAVEIPKLKKGENFTIDVLAYDGESYSLGFVITGSVANSPPIIGSKTDSVMAPSDSFSHQLSAVDPDGDKLTFSLISGPSTVTIDPNTGVISGKVTKTEVIEIRATDPEGAYLDYRFTLTPAKK